MKKVSTPAMVIYVILALVVGSYLYYSQYYIPHKEDILINKGVRTLASIDEGISNKQDFLKSFMGQRVDANTQLSYMADYPSQDVSVNINRFNFDTIINPGGDSCDIRLWWLDAQKTIISNHIKPLPIYTGEWEELKPDITFHHSRDGEPAYLELKHIHEVRNDSLTNALRDQLREKANKDSLQRVAIEKDLRNLMRMQKEAFLIMGGESSDYTKNYLYQTPYGSVQPSRTQVEAEDVLTNEKFTARVTLDTLLSDVMENEIFQCLVLHSADSEDVFYSSDPRVINPMRKFDGDKSDSIATRFGVNIFETQVNSKPYVEFRRYIQLGDKSLYLSGFISKDDYNEYLREIDYFVLILVLLLTFTLIGAVPLIKVFVINEWERLRDRDVLLSALSLLFVVFLGSLIFFTVHHYSEVEHQLEHDIEHYGNRMKGNFVNEIDSLVTHTKDFDFDSMGYWKNSDDILFHEFFETTDGTIERIILPYDEFGCNWDTVSDIGKFFRKYVNLSGRDYIKKVKSSDAYLLVHPNHDFQELYLESVFSYSRAQKEAVISYPKGDKINGISVDLKSLMWSIPPEGFGYALIDRDMNVLFSSKKAKNNFKNLRTDLVGMEFIDQSITYGKPLQGHFDFGRDKFIGQVTPIDGIVTQRGKDPAFFLITFANHDLVEWHTGLTSLLSALASFGILMASFLLLILQSLFSINQKESRFFRQSNFYDTIFPERQDGLTYLFLSIISLLGVIIGVFLYRYGLSALIRYGVVQVLLFGLLRPLLLSYNDSPKGLFRRRGYFFTTFIILFSAILFLPGGIPGGAPDKIILTAYTLIAISLGLLVHKQMLKSKGKPFALKRSSLFHKLKFILQSKTVKNVYIFSMYAWILAILVFPFFLISDKCEEIVANSFQALSGNQINQQLEDENADLLQLYGEYNSITTKINQLHLDEEWETFMTDELYFGTDISQKVKTYEYAHYFQPIFSLFANRYSYDPLYVSAKGHGYCKKKKEFAPDPNPADSLSGKSEKRPEKSHTAESNEAGSGTFGRNTLFFIFSLLLLYALVRLFLNRIVFNISPELQGGRVRAYSVIDSLEKYQAHKLETNLPMRLFLVGIPRSRRTTILKSLQLTRADLGFIDFGRNTSFLDEEYDIVHIPPELVNAKAIVIRFWFPEDVTDEYLNRLRKLTRYMEETVLYNKGSVILSDLTITQIEEKWYEMNTGAQAAASSREVMLYLKEWFRSYREFLLPLEKERFGDSAAINGQIGFDDAYDDYLNKSYYSPIYFSVWHSLSVKERFIVYDLAEDGLMNARDSFMLMKLKRKGILSYNRNNYRMELFHRSFNLFVKNGVSTTEIMNIERFSKKNGSWGQIRLALLLLILAMLLFIYELMPNMFNALAGAIGVIASFSGAVSQLSGKVSLPQFGKLFGGNKGSGVA
ncbi:hypothetical protein O3Q51_09830 [Cryomorphaceae bacterium 1068]|nr:hypothetical protein [Cryomorphaceae bacterium 1068]